jgi:hypothetical protein
MPGQDAEAERRPRLGALVQAGVALSPFGQISAFAARFEVGVLVGKTLPMLPTFEMGLQAGMLHLPFALE